MKLKQKETLIFNFYSSYKKAPSINIDSFTCTNNKSSLLFVWNNFLSFRKNLNVNQNEFLELITDFISWDNETGDIEDPIGGFLMIK